MLRPLALVFAFSLGSLLASTAPPTEPEPEPKPCCKICRKGKACGDTCIAKDKDCTVPEGCACDADE